MNNCKRFGNKWTINEVLSLQREYELLEMSVEDIAIRHQRSVTAILYKLKNEGMIYEFSDVSGYAKYIVKEQEDDDSTYVDEEDFDDDDSTYIDEDCNDIEEGQEETGSLVILEEIKSEINSVKSRLRGFETTILQNSQRINQILELLITRNNRTETACHKENFSMSSNIKEEFVNHYL